MQRREQPNQETIRKKRKVLGNIGSRHHQINIHKRKEIKKKSISGERENYLKPSSIVWKGKTPRLSPL